EKTAADGWPIRAQVAPRPVGLLLGLQSSIHPFSFHPSYRPIAHLPLEQQVAALHDPALRSAILGSADANALRRVTDYERMFPLGAPPVYEPAPETSLAAIAAQRGVDPAEVAYDLMLEDGGRAFLFAPFSNYADLNLDACGEMVAHPDTVMGLGD